MLEFPLNQLQTYYGYLCDLLSFMQRMLATKMVIFLSQTESIHKYFFSKKALYVWIYVCMYVVCMNIYMTLVG
jgi:hypothetical protein